MPQASREGRIIRSSRQTREFGGRLGQRLLDSREAIDAEVRSLTRARSSVACVSNHSELRKFPNTTITDRATELTFSIHSGVNLKHIDTFSRSPSSDTLEFFALIIARSIIDAHHGYEHGT